MGLYRAGFDVVGVDYAKQPNYPFRFVQANALHPPVNLGAFDLIWASPPCQKHVGFNRAWNTRVQVCHIEKVRELLSGLPLTVIENVVGAPLKNAVRLCGSNFGLKVRRHRLFETTFPISQLKCQHPDRCIGVYGDHPQRTLGDGYRIPRASSLREGAEAMGIEWMTWRELTQAIPPAYSEYIGHAALAMLDRRLAA